MLQGLPAAQNLAVDRTFTGDDRMAPRDQWFASLEPQLPRALGLTQEILADGFE